MIKWDFFRRRRRLDIDAWMSSSKIESYDDFCRVLQSLGVVTPGIDEYEVYKPKPIPELKPKPKPKPKPKTRTRKKQPAIIDGDSVINDEASSDD